MISSKSWYLWMCAIKWWTNPPRCSILKMTTWERSSSETFSPTPSPRGRSSMWVAQTFQTSRWFADFCFVKNLSLSDFCGGSPRESEDSVDLLKHLHTQWNLLRSKLTLSARINLKKEEESSRNGPTIHNSCYYAISECDINCELSADYKTKKATLVINHKIDWWQETMSWVWCLITEKGRSMWCLITETVMFDHRNSASSKVVWWPLHMSLEKEGWKLLMEKNPKESLDNDCSTFLAAAAVCSWPRWSHKKRGCGSKMWKIERHSQNPTRRMLWTFVGPHNILNWPADQTNDQYSVTENAVVEATEMLFSWKVWSTAWSVEQIFYRRNGLVGR